ncbi:MAG: protein kinase domain-containing protein [Pyrinomonadaceae bacterium]
MTIAGGTKLGRYEIQSPLGAGGMGEVYLAEDTQLSRRVALKLLPAQATQDQDSLRRFQQEARAASALSHPNIAHIYEIGEADGVHFIAMEYVAGQSLGERINRRPLPAPEVAHISAQIADALDEAHQAGVTHRDIKAGNIMLTARGRVKVLDFGLAKIVAPEAESEAATRVKTKPGVVMGTVSYMSPEQAMGRDVDARTDIWSLGVLLYEMATGRLPFKGDSVTETIDSIAHAQPEAVARFNYDVPVELEVIIKKALRKRREERYQTARDMFVDLQSLARELELTGEHSVAPEARDGAPQARTGADASGAPSTGAQSAAPGSEQATRTLTRPQTAATDAVTAERTTSSAEYIVTEIKRHKRVALSALVALVVLVAALGAYRYFTVRQAAGHFASGRKLNVKRLTSSGKVGDAVVSPDGRYVAYIAGIGDKQSIRLLQVNTASDVEIVAPVEPPLRMLNFSRDGEYLYYHHYVGNTGTLYQVPALGGTPRQIRYNIDSGAAVSPDGKTLAFVVEEHLPDEAVTEMLLSDADGSNVRSIAAHKAPGTYFWEGYTPAWSPNGKMIACGIDYKKENERHLKLVALSVADGAEQPLSDREWDAIFGVAWLADGNLIVSGKLKTGVPDQRVQLWLVRAGGAPEALTTELLDYYGVSMTAEGGALLTTQDQYSEALWITPNNDATRAVRAVQETASFYQPSWTPDGRLLYVSTAGGSRNIWVVNADGTNKKQLTNQCNCTGPRMSADGRYIIYRLYNVEQQGHVWRMDADGGNQKRLTNGSGEDWPTFSRDGKWVIYSQFGGDNTSTLWKVPLEGGASVQLATTTWQAFAPTVSPLDGSIAYMFYDKDENYVRKISVIPADGGAPLRTFAYPKEGMNFNVMSFTPDGRSLAFIGKRDNGANVWTIPADGNGPPKPLTDFKTEAIFGNFAWSADGKQLALIRGTEATDAVSLSEAK